MATFSRLTAYTLLLALLFFALVFPTAAAQSGPRIRPSREVTAEPGVPRPASVPVAVPLFRDVTFTDYSSHPFAFVPPPGGRRRWAKIVLVGDFFVTAGRQFDRSGEISVGHTNIFFGTTAEPSDKLSPAWHAERDLTEYAALFHSVQPGEVTLGNTVDTKYTGIIHGTVSLLFYPAAQPAALPPVPDEVLPLPAGKNGIGSANTPADTVSATYTLPTNTVRAYLDLITESQGTDEFWYLNVPDSLTKQLQSGGGTAFREAEIRVDGRPAGVAPVFPWIYTGGIDPGLWGPIPGVQTLNFVPYRVNLTPFVGILNDGHPHTVGVRIENNQNHFQIAGVLLLFRDPKWKVVHGALTADTLTANPVLTVTSQITGTHGAVSGPVSVTSMRFFTIAGYVRTSAGKITTKISQNTGFSSVQQFEKSAAKDGENVQQTTGVVSVTQTQTPHGSFIQRDEFRYPLTVRFDRVTSPNGTATQTTTIRQSREVTHTAIRNGQVIGFSQSTDAVNPTSTLEFSAAGKLVRRSRRSEQVYRVSHGSGTASVHILKAADGIITSDTTTGKPR